MIGSMIRPAIFILSSLMLLPTAIATPKAGQPTILAFSATAEGNGYNWPASLAWLSEQLLITREEGLELQNHGSDVRIDISSMGGGSSGAAVTMILNAALSNPNLVASNAASTGQRLLTLEEAKRVADTIRFVSFALDLSKGEDSTTAMRTIQIQIATRIKMLASHIPFIREWFKIEKPVWVPVINSKYVISEFGRYINFVRLVDYGTIDQSITKMPGYSQLRSQAAADPQIAEMLATVHRIHDLPKEKLGKQEPLTGNERNWLKSFANLRRTAIKSAVQQTLAKQTRGPQDVLLRYGADMTPPDTDGRGGVRNNPFATTLAENMQTGFMTMGLMAHFDSPQDFDQSMRKTGKVDYSKLRLYAFMNEETANQILSSADYRSAVKDPNSRMRRFVIAVVDQQFSAMNASVREPALMEELYGDVGSNQFRIRRIYDPLADESHTFQTVETTAPRFQNRPIFAIGGFASQAIGAQLQSMVHGARIKILEKSGASVISRYHTLGKPHTWYKDSYFGTHQLTHIMNEGGTDEGQRNIKDYFDWMDDFYKSTIETLRSKGNAVVQTWENWDIRILPGAIAGVADQQVAKSVNSARLAWKVAPSGAEFKPRMLGAVDREPNKGILDPKVTTAAPTCDALWLGM